MCQCPEIIQLRVIVKTIRAAGCHYYIFLRLHLLHFGECEIWSSSIAFALCEIERFRETRIDSSTTQLQFNLLSSVDDIIAAAGDPSAGLRMNLNTSVTQVRVHTHYVYYVSQRPRAHAHVSGITIQQAHSAEHARLWISVYASLMSTHHASATLSSCCNLTHNHKE